jgi:hypothetical protein
MLKANIIVWLINLTVLAFLSIIGPGWVSLINSGYFPKILLLETGIAFLIGGAMAFSGSVSPSKIKEQVTHSKEKWSMENLRKSEKKANMYIILAVLLFVQSLLVSFLIP